MKKNIIAIALGAAFALPAIAQDAAPASPHTLTGNVAVVSDYIFRGISQTQHKPAIQAGIDYSHASGIYLGVWGSNVNWVSLGGAGPKPDNSLEADFYGGFRNTIGDFGYDIGLIRYYYPGNTAAGATTPNTTEAYIAGTWKFITLKYSNTLSDYMVGWPSKDGGKTKGSDYWDLSAAYDLGEGWGINGHIGHQKIKNRSSASYTDWKLGVTKDVGFGVVGLSYTDTDADGGVGEDYRWDGKNVGDARAVLSFSKTF